MPTESTANYRGVFLFFAVLALLAWLLPVRADWIIVPRLVLFVFSIVAGWLWFTNPPPAPHDAPDILAQRVGTYFERTGLCFAPVLSVEDGVCWFHIFCQNRYANPCTGTICVIPMEGTSPTGAHEVPPVVVDIHGEGGEVGVISLPYPIARSRQGTLMIYDVFAYVSYPQRKGKLLRSAEGRPVELPPTKFMTNAFNTIRTGGLLLVGIVPIEGVSASVELRLPQDVSECIPAGAQLRTETIWRLCDFSIGFPVVEKPRSKT